MFSRTKLYSSSLVIGLILTGGTIGMAQEPQTQNPNQSTETKQRRSGRGEHGGRKRAHRGFFGPQIMQELNLTENQRQQMRTIMQQNMESNKGLREELRQMGEKRRSGTLSEEDRARAKTLREQMRASMQNTHAQMTALLTAEQRTRAEQLMQERKSNREGFGKRRDGFRQRRGDGTQPQKPPTSPQ